MNVDPGLMVWTVITFVVLLVVLRFTAWKPLLASLDARERRIREAVEGAERARQESEALLVRHREMLDKAMDEAHQIIEEGKADGLRLKHEITAQARVEAEELRARSLKEIDLATDQAKKELFVQASQLSVDLAERILRRSLDSADQRKLIERVLEEYRSEKQPT
jgi:F-type H+-transporting ATPase subunit b